MSTTTKTPTYAQFRKNPLVAMLFIAVMALGTMMGIVVKVYYDRDKAQTKRIEELENKYDLLNQRFIDTITELKHHDE